MFTKTTQSESHATVSLDELRQFGLSEQGAEDAKARLAALREQAQAQRPQDQK